MTTRNSNARFELAPQVEIERSTFDRSTNIKTSFNVGELIPFYVDEVLPGDTFEISTSKVARLQTLLTPVMDNLYLDTYYFFVPNRLVWEHWKEFMGENSTSAWYPTVQYNVPQVLPPMNGWSVGTIADYMGIPTGVEAEDVDGGINALPFRAYALIVNEWFRDENLQQPVNIPKNDSTIDGSNGSNYVTDLVKGGKPFIACKYHDYFTSCLPAPQKGPDVSFLDGYAPVVPMTEPYAQDVAQSYRTNSTRIKNPQGTNVNGYLQGTGGSLATATQSGTLSNYVHFGNLYADLSGAVKYDEWNADNPGVTINDLRRAFQIQRLYEKDARGGTRYIELLKAHFGVTSPDARLQRPEYIGGDRVPLNVEQVVQTSSTDATSPLAHLGAFSQTADYSSDVRKSFVEHGFVIGLMCARYDHSYQQGLEKMWSRFNRFDYYWPALAHLGEKAVTLDEIYWEGRNDAPVFGYQEAWSEYKYKPNYVTGQMRSQYQQSLDIWHFADDYKNAPSLSSSWIVEDKSNIDRCLAVSSSNANQIFADILVSNKCTRPMPLYSIPGLIDHF